MNIFTHTVFTSRNTARNEEINAVNLKSAVRKARKYELERSWNGIDIPKQIVSGDGGWVELEKGKIVAATDIALLGY